MNLGCAGRSLHEDDTTHRHLCQISFYLDYDAIERNFESASLSARPHSTFHATSASELTTSLGLQTRKHFRHRLPCVSNLRRGAPGALSKTATCGLASLRLSVQSLTPSSTVTRVFVSVFSVVGAPEAYLGRSHPPHKL